MNRKAIWMSASVLSVLLTASAARADGPAAAPPPPPPAVPTTSTTTTTSADAESAAITARPSTSEPREQDTVTVYRSVRPNPAYLVVGGLLLAGSYVPTALVAGASDRSADKNLLVPIVGPWLNLTDRQCANCENETRNAGFIVASGIAQGVGAGLILMSFIIPQKVEAATIQAGPMRMNVLPSTARGSVGAFAVGTF